MANRELRELERRAAAGDAQAAEELRAARARAVVSACCELAPGPGPRTKPAWVALADALERRVREARTELALAQAHADDLAAWDWTLEEIEAALAERPDLLCRAHDGDLLIYVDAGGVDQFAWRRHPQVHDRWQFVAERLAEDLAPRERGWPAEPLPPGEPGPAVELEDGTLVDSVTGEVLGAALPPIEQESAGGGGPDLPSPPPPEDPPPTEEVSEAPAGAEGPITPAPAGEHAPSEEDVAWADEIESLCNFACEIQQVEAREQAVKEASACTTPEEVAAVRARIQATLQGEERVRAQFLGQGKRYGHGPTRSEVQREKAARKPRGNAVARARERVADGDRERCLELLRLAFPLPGTAPVGLRKEIEAASPERLVQLIEQLQRAVPAKGAPAAAAGGLFGGGGE